MAVSTYLKLFDIGLADCVYHCETFFLGDFEVMYSRFDMSLGFFALMALLYSLCQLFGHFRPDIIFCLGPVCVRLCLRLKIPFLQPTRTRGLAVPVDVSLYGVTSSPNVTSCIVSPFGIFPSL